MKKSFYNSILLIAGLSIAGATSSCMFNCVRGSGHQVTETRKMTDFTKIDISGGFTVVLKQDSSLTVNVAADDNLQKYIKTYVDGDVLNIDTHNKNICNNDATTITIGVRSLEELKSSGAIELTGEGKLVTKDLVFHLSGASKITLDLNAANVTTDGSGVCELDLTGQASSHHIDVSGVAKIHALDFVVGDYNIETSGASHCEINVLNSLTVHSSGASEVKYRGNPSSVTNDKSGASSLEKIN